MKQSELDDLVNAIIDAESTRSTSELGAILRNCKSGNERLEEILTFTISQIPAISARVAVSLLLAAGILDIEDEEFYQ